MAKQTGSYDFKAAKEAHDAAAKTATNYIALHPTDGIKIANANPSTATTYQHQTATNTEFVVNNVSRMLLGGEGARVGRTSQGHAVVTEDGFNYLQGDNSMFAVEAYGDEVYAIGTEYGPRTVIPAGGSATVSGGYNPRTVEENPCALYQLDSGLWAKAGEGDVYVAAAQSSTNFDGSAVSVSFNIVNTTSSPVTAVVAEAFDRRSVRTRIGKGYVQGATDNESHMELDYHSLQMVDKEGDAFFHVSDLRLADGVYTATETLPIRNGYPNSNAATVTTGIHPIEELVSVTYNSGADDDTANWSIRLSSSGSQLAANNLIRSGSFDDVEMSHIEDGSVTVVYKTKAPMAKAFSFGGRQNGSAIGGMSFAAGDYNVASGFASAAFGSLTKAKSSCSFAEGDYTEATGAAAHSEGVSTKAKGAADHAEGWSAVAEGGNFGDDQWGEIASQDEKYAPAHAEGYQTQATAAGSHAEGLYSTATRPGAHAGGCKSEAKGRGSFAHGYRVVANGQGQAVFGNRNVEDTEGKYAFIIGNGEGLDDETSNALAVAWNGNLITQAMAGIIQMFAGATAPDGWLNCDGSAVSRTTYATLFAAIGTTWGAGDGSTTFNLPDLRGRAPIGAGTGSGLTARTLAGKGGSENIQAHTHAFTQPKIPNHVHGNATTGQKFLTSSDNIAVNGTKRAYTSASDSGHYFVYGEDKNGINESANTGNPTALGACTGGAVGAVSGATTGTAGNMQPFAVVNFIICTGKTS